MAQDLRLGTLVVDYHDSLVNAIPDSPFEMVSDAQRAATAAAAICYGIALTTPRRRCRRACAMPADLSAGRGIHGANFVVDEHTDVPHAEPRGGGLRRERAGAAGARARGRG